MKNVDDGHDVLVPGNSTGSKRTSTTPPDITAVSHLLEQGKLCKDLYLSLGVNHSDIGESSDEDVASILEQMSRFQTSGDPIGRNCERNIADILKEAESLLDEQHHEAQPQSRASGGSFFQCCEFSQMSSLSNNIMDSTSLKDPYQPLSESVKSLDKVLNSTFTKQAELKSSASEVLSSSSENRNCKQSHTIKDCNSRDSAIRLSPPHMVGTPLEVTYQRIHEQIRKEMDGSLMPLLQGDFPDLKMSMPIPGLETPCVDAPSCFSLEQEFLEERKRCLKLRADLDWLKRQYEREVAELRRRHEGQLLQIREEFSSHDDKDTRILSLEKEVETQEKIIAGYQLENEQICAELKEVKEKLQETTDRDDAKKVFSELEREREAARQSEVRVRDLERRLLEQDQDREEVRRLQLQLEEKRKSELQLREQLQCAEAELRERHAGAAKVQVQLHAVKTKYEELVGSLELQLSSARAEVMELRERVLNVPSSASSEAGGESEQAPRRLRTALRKQPRPRRSQSVGEEDGAERATLAVMPHQQNRPTPPARPDTHLLATIRGLQSELSAKEKDMGRLNRELSDARATNRRLQQERQRLLQEAGAARNKPQQQPPPPPPHDPDMEAENRGLRKDVARLQEDLLSLHAKRVSDLTRLQAKHEREVEEMVCERVNERLSDRNCEGRVAELQGQLYTQQLVIAHLKEQLKQCDHSQDEIALLKKERDQLEKSVMELNKQVLRLKDAASPEATRLAALQDQVEELQAKHEAREHKLQGIVKDLMQAQGRSESQSHSCPASLRLLHKNRDLCFYRAELDRMLESLSDLQQRSRAEAGAGPSSS